MIAYLLNLATLAAIFAIAASSLNVLVGYAGLFSVAHAVFFGVGAYAAAQLALQVVPDVLLACVLGGLLSALLSLCLAVPSLRVRGEYLVAASLGLQMMAVTVFSEAHTLTGGHGGLAGIPTPKLLGADVSSPPVYLTICLCVLALCLYVTAVLMRGSFGRALMAIRDSETAAQAFGKNVPMVKTLAVAFGCGLAGVAGALFVFYLAFINVESFVMEQSVFMLAMVIIGGAGTLIGPVIGAVLLLSLPPLLSFVPMIPPTEIGTVQQFIYGFAMTLLMIFRPAGLAGRVGGK